MIMTILQFTANVNGIPVNVTVLVAESVRFANVTSSLAERGARDLTSITQWIDALAQTNTDWLALAEE